MRVILGVAVLAVLTAVSPGRASASPEAGSSPRTEPAREAAPAPAREAAPEPAREAAPEPAREAAPGASPGARPLAGGPPPEDASPSSGATVEKTSPLPKKKSLSHRMQVGVELGVGAGYSFLITYRDSTWCGQLDGADNASFCSGLHPVHLDFGLSFGVLDRLDVLAEFRLGLMDDPTNNRPLMLMPGLRVWIDPELPFKIGVGFQLIVDLTKQSSSEQRIYGPPVKGETVDLGGRIFGQFQYDFLRYFGIYFKVDASVTARRWLQVNIGGQLGVQARFP